MAGRKRLAGERGFLLALDSRSSRNLRNMIQVSIGSRSRSPFSPLSLRMMSRADLSRLPRALGGGLGLRRFWSCGCEPFIAFLCGVQKILQFADGEAELFGPAEEVDDLADLAVG